MKKFWCSIFFTTIITNFVFAVNEIPPVGARATAMGNAANTASDLWSVNNNQAGMGFLESPLVGFSLNNQFLVSELSTKTVSMVYPTINGVLGATYSHFGYSKYNENRVGLGYAKLFSKKFAFGLMLDYIHTTFGNEYGNRGAITFELGLMYKISKQLTIGSHIYNPMQIKIDTYSGEKLPTFFNLGFDYRFSDKVILAVEAEKELENPVAVKAGIEYHLIPEIYLRAGASNQPFSNSFGFGLNLNKLKVDFATSVNATLGYSPQISLMYQFK